MTRDRFVHVGRLHQAAAARKPGVIDAYMKKGRLVTIRKKPFIQLSDADYQAIRADFALIKTSPRLRALSPSGRGQGEGPGASPPTKSGLGDALHKVAGPIGRSIKWPCMKKDGTTDLIPGSPCDRARKLLNKL
jgi:hypothetical protein